MPATESRSKVYQHVHVLSVFICTDTVGFYFFVTNEHLQEVQHAQERCHQLCEEVRLIEPSC